MSIKDFTEKIKPFWTYIKGGFYDIKNNLKIKEDLFIVILIVIVGLSSFGLGKLSALESQKTLISIDNTQVLVNDDTSQNHSNTSIENSGADLTNISTSSEKGTVFSSKSGTKYYYPWCSGAARIKDANRVWFNTIAEAKSAGLTPAANCPGLK